VVYVFQIVLASHTALNSGFLIVFCLHLHTIVLTYQFLVDQKSGFFFFVFPKKQMAFFTENINGFGCHGVFYHDLRPQKSIFSSGGNYWINPWIYSVINSVAKKRVYSSGKL
jgi:hypothetical protein